MSAITITARFNGVSDLGGFPIGVVEDLAGTEYTLCTFVEESPQPHSITRYVTNPSSLVIGKTYAFVETQQPIKYRASGGLRTESTALPVLTPRLAH